MVETPSERAYREENELGNSSGAAKDRRIRTSKEDWEGIVSKSRITKKIIQEEGRN